VRLDESSCPFCRAALPASFQQQTPLGAAARKLNRAALYALRMGAASATALAATACSAENTGAEEGTNTAALSASATPLYGGFFHPDSGIICVPPRAAAGDPTNAVRICVPVPDDGGTHATPLYGGFGVDPSGN